MRRRLLVAACILTALGCGRSQAKDAPAKPVAQSSGPSAAAKAAFVDAGNWASKVGTVLDQPVRAPAAASPEAEQVHAAVMLDDGEDTDEPVLAGRLVYRVRYSVPPSFRDRRASVEAPAGELQVDLSRSRLRARFVGPGWPVPERSELRLRADLPGVYLFDGEGGRSLGAGQLASWFEGQRSGKPAATVAAVRKDWGPHAAGPLAGDMICALLAEWSHQSREALAYRCEPDALPPAFRLGPWFAELTAVVPVQLPRNALRADHVAPPHPLPRARPNTPMLEAAALAQLVPWRATPGPADASLVVENVSNARVLLIMQGVPIGWIDAEATMTVPGLQPGWYRTGAVRPLGVLRMPPKLLRVPGTLTIGRTQLEHPPPASAQPDSRR